MALDPAYFFYSEGTITLTNGSDIATGDMVAWDPALLPFDFVFPNDGLGGATVIKEVLAVDQIRLAKPWTGPTLTDVPYFALRFANHIDPRFYAIRVSEYLARLKAIPENFEEVGQQVATDAAAVASAFATITQAAADVEADRQAVESATSGIEQDRQEVVTLHAATLAARDVAVSAAGSTQALWDSRVTAAGANIPAPVQYVLTAGYAQAGDGGGALFKRVATPATPKAWHFQSADGAWWQIAESKINVRMLGAKGDGVSDDAPAINAAIQFSYNVRVPEGSYRLNTGLVLRPGCSLVGDGEPTKLIRGFSGGPLIRHPGGEQAGDAISLRDFLVDTASGVTVAAGDTGIDIGATTRWSGRGEIANLIILHQWDGFKWKAGTMGPISNIQCHENKGNGFVGVDPRGELNGCLAQYNAGHGYFMYTETTGETGIQFSGCGTFGNQGWGYMFDAVTEGANVYMRGVSSSTDGMGGIGFVKKHSQIWMTQILIESAGDAYVPFPIFTKYDGAVGLYLVDGCELVQGSDIYIQHTRGGGAFFDGVKRMSLSNLTVIDSGRGGLGGQHAVGVNFNANNTDVKITNLIANFGASQTTDIANGAGTNKVDLLNPSFNTYFKAGADMRFMNPRTNAPDSVASASVMTLPDYTDFITVTGTSNIDAITASWKGRRVTLIFAGALGVTDGNNLKLNGVFITSADDTLTLICDGTNWIEVSRSAN